MTRLQSDDAAPARAESEAEQREAEAAAREAEAARVATEQVAAQQQAARQAALAESHAFWDAVEFASVLTDEGCADMTDSVGRLAAHETWSKLSEYQPSTERDAALRSLDRCRDMLVKVEKGLAATSIRDARQAFAVALEDAYDEANPYSRGDLVATVSGSRLTVTMSGGFGGRARHTEAELNSWCDEDTAVFFSKITLKSKAHGTYTCVPSLWPGSEQAVIGFLVDENLRDAWSRGSGEKPTPPKPTVIEAEEHPASQPTSN